MFTDMAYCKNSCLLFDLISKGDLLLINTILAFKPKLSVKDDMNRNALFYTLNIDATIETKVSIVSSLISGGKINNLT